MSEEMRTTRYGKELWKYLIGFVLLLLMAEMFIERESKNKIERASAEKFGRAQ